MINHYVNFGILKGVQKNEVIAGIQVPISSYTWAAGKEIFRNIVGCAYCFVLAVSNIHPQIQENIPQSAFLHLIKLYYKNVLSVQFIHSVMSDSLRPHGLQHTRLPCPSPTPRAFSNSCPSSQWCHPTISSSVFPFSSHLQSFLASGSFQMSQFFTSGGQIMEFQLQHQFFQWIFRIDFL